MNKSLLSLSYFCIFLTCLSPVLGLRECKFPAIFNFGDSNSDTGGSVAIFIPLGPPYGDTFFHKPSGRYSDGRLLIDFIAKNLSLPFLSSYLDSLGSNFSHGANFAATAATVRLSQSIFPAGRNSPFYLDLQYLQFTIFMNKSQIIRKGGGVFKDLMPKIEYFSKALYTIDIGENDLVAGFRNGSTIKEIKASIPNIVHSLSNNLKLLYKSGARNFLVHNVVPIGCLPLFLISNFTNDDRKDNVGCRRPYNEVAQYFNYKLKEEITQLRKDLHRSAIIYVDIYAITYSLLVNHHKYGFESPLIACCGIGGKYNYNPAANCGSITSINGRNISVGSCERPEARICWDGIHNTDAANEFIVEQISKGAYSDPPIPLGMACHRI